MNIVDLIRKETAALPVEKVAVCEGKSVLTYAVLFEKVDAVADLLKQQGVMPLERVGLAWPDSGDYIVMSLAVLSIGAVIVPVPFGAAKEVVDEMMEKTAASFLLSPDSAGTGIERGGFSLKTYSSAHSLPAEYNEIEPAFIRFSSGTTQVSKGVLLSHSDVAERTTLANQALQITADDTVIWLLSMSFHFVVTILLFLRRGATINLCSDTFPLSFLSAVEQGGGTFIYGTPFHFQTLTENTRIQSGALADIRMAVSTAMKLSDEAAFAFSEKFGFELIEAYGLIEVGLPFVNCGAKSGSVGKPLAGIEIQLRNADENGVGEVWLRGPGMYSAYLHPWKRRSEDEWFGSGDVGRMDESGNLYLLGRTKNLINFAGMKVFPYEVESVLARCDGVEEVLVYAESHARYGQLPCARIVAHGRTVAELQRYGYEHLESYKVPKKIELVDVLERTASGKLKRAEPACF